MGQGQEFNKENSIALKEYIEINGHQQGMIIKGDNLDNPMLLFLHGGPGIPNYPAIRTSEVSLEKHFTVCYWDQRGTGMSYDKNKKASLTVEQLIEDTFELTKYLCHKYGKEKIYLLGHSWGTYLGSLVASRYPSYYHAYIGVGQLGSAKESATEDTSKNKIFHRMGKNLSKYGGTLWRRRYSYWRLLKDISGIEGYTYRERLNIILGSIHSIRTLGYELIANDLIVSTPQFNVPVFIIQGKQDLPASVTQGRKFFELLEAPQKRMYMFEYSAHYPFLEEQERFEEVITEDILKTNN